MMQNEIINETHLLFQEDVRLTDVKEYGFSWEQFVTGIEPIPAEGLKFDIHFEGDVIGDTIAGTIHGIDYLTVRADGRLFLDLHATITTHDHVEIHVTETGINDQGNLQLNMDFHTNDSRYSWLNRKHIWGIGKVDFQTGQVKINAYQN